MTITKFKIGDRVKWKDCEGCARSGNIVDVPFGCAIFPAIFYVKEAQELPPGPWHESHLSLDVPEAPKFKPGDRVKWKDVEGRDHLGVIVEDIPSRGCWLVLEPDGCSGRWYESRLSLDVFAPKQFATKLEAELGAEIIRLNFQIADQKKMSSVQAKGRMEDREQIKNLAHLDARLTEEVGERHRERIAKESAQKELAEAIESTRSANAAYLDIVIKLSSVQKELAEAREQIERLERKSKVQVDGITHLSYRLTEEIGNCVRERLAKESRQKELAEANDKIKRLKSLVGEM